MAQFVLPAHPACAGVYHFNNTEVPSDFCTSSKYQVAVSGPVQLKLWSQLTGVPLGAINATPRRFAVMFLLPSIVTVNGLLVPLAAPLQPMKRYPAFGTTVNCTTEPAV